MGDRRRTSGKARGSDGSRIPAAVRLSEVPRDYTDTLSEIKSRIGRERVRVVLAASSALVLLYWDLGRLILDRQGKAVTNFSTTLPNPDSDLAQQTFKDPYLFDFLGTRTSTWTCSSTT